MAYFVCNDGLQGDNKHIVDRITSQMMIVNIQALIHNLRVGDHPRVKVYAHAVVPLMATCRPSTFAYLKGILIDGDYREMEVEKIIQAIESTYPCALDGFGLSFGMGFEAVYPRL